MPRYIDADALKDRMLNYYECVNADTSKSNYKGETLMNYDVADMIEDCIDNAPTADVVEVVRCKDCVNRVQFDTNKFHCEITGYYCGETGYCSDGVRKQKERSDNQCQQE